MSLKLTNFKLITIAVPYQLTYEATVILKLLGLLAIFWGKASL